MPREIFGEVVDPAPQLGSRSKFAVPVSMAVHVVLAAVVIIVPLMATDAMPDPRSAVIAVFNVPPALPTPPRRLGAARQ